MLCGTTLSKIYGASVFLLPEKPKVIFRVRGMQSRSLLFAYFCLGMLRNSSEDWLLVHNVRGCKDRIAGVHNHTGEDGVGLSVIRFLRICQGFRAASRTWEGSLAGTANRRGKT